jgi:hypothetical protein
LVENELPIAAEALYKGFIISWIDKADSTVLDSINQRDKELPVVLTFSEADSTPIFCCVGREMNADGIRLWG